MLFAACLPLFAVLSASPCWRPARMQRWICTPRKPQRWFLPRMQRTLFGSRSFGNGNYPDAAEPLILLNDASSFAYAMRRQGFNVDRVEDAQRQIWLARSSDLSKK